MVRWAVDEGTLRDQLLNQIVGAGVTPLVFTMFRVYNQNSSLQKGVKRLTKSCPVRWCVETNTDESKENEFISSGPHCSGHILWKTQPKSTTEGKLSEGNAFFVKVYGNSCREWE